ncbi:FAD-dependent oxidoreductase [Akkermansiaceae bacterium]|nr:FAD-dependent oxidoreductase [Akkermansiaceae bacterium]
MNVVIVGAGVAGVNAATKLVDNNFKGKITIIDMGKNPYDRLPEEVMTGFLGAGGWSDGKLTYHTSIGGQLSKYCGEDKAMELFDQVITNFKRFHPKPEEVQCSDPQAEPDFIKPHFGLRLFPVWHVGTDYLHEIGKNWYNHLVDNGVEFIWETKVHAIDFENGRVLGKSLVKDIHTEDRYDKLIFGVGKSGIDFGKQLAEEYDLPTEPKSVQIGVRFEAPQKHFQKLIDVSYDFKLYQKFEDKGVSLRSFCTNNNAAYVAAEHTYGDVSYNGHAKKDPSFRNDMTNFGILMEIKGIDTPFDWSRAAVEKLQHDGVGTFYSPSSRVPSKTSEGDYVKCHVVNSMDILYDAIGEYALHIEDFIEDMKKVFPTLGSDWGVYMPEVKYLSPEPLVDYSNLALTRFPEVHFVGDALSARGITVSGAQGTYVAESILNN